MTGKERFVAVASGQPADRTPIVVWPDPDQRSDVAVVRVARIHDAHATNPGKAVLAEIVNPLGRAIARSITLPKTLRESPEDGQAKLQQLVEETRADIDLALAAGADGIFYRLEGAHPPVTTPMEYGGFFLEADRQLLQSAESGKANVLFAHGTADYFEFLTDLPAHVFAWDRELAGDVLERVRSMRKGPLACMDGRADVILTDSYDAAEALLS